MRKQTVVIGAAVFELEQLDDRQMTITSTVRDAPTIRLVATIEQAETLADVILTFVRMIARGS